MRQFVMSKADKLLLDLRGNPGGYLDSAVDISSWFLAKGEVVVTEDYGGNRDPVIFRSRGYDEMLPGKIKFVILIDGGSASASEIVAGAMQDHKKALLVGDKSFGKGSVQEVVKITPETLLKITVAKWLTPNGHTIAEMGLTPDYKVELSREEYDAKKDPQMDKAVGLLNKWPGMK
jgi:carboxyl-terminal processing protease